MITLLEPPRPPGLPSGGFRYQERVVAALGDDASRISVPPAALHDKVLELRRQDPSAQVVVDGWFADLAAAPLPDDVTALLHMAPARPDWSTRPLHVVATGQPTADAVARASILRRESVPESACARWRQCIDRPARGEPRDAAGRR